MAQSNRPPGGRPTGGSDRKPGGGSKRRTPAPQVKKPFPWGVVAVSTVLGLALIGILAYAVTNQGAGFKSALSIADEKVDGVKKFDGLKASHVQGPVQYEDEPPAGGDHNSTPQSCQVYTAPIAPENALHSLEHGAVWVTYAPDLPADDVAKLTELVQGDPYRMLSPYPGLTGGKVSLQAWERQLRVDSVNDPRIEQFLEAYTSGPQAPEQGAACTGTTSTGPLQSAPAPPPAAPSGAPSAAPSAGASPAAG